ncbi:TPA: hypothetical protein RSW61_003694 [Vibrio harveyi]|nr:hypothetical protein [Vibrio harveyi]HDZ3732067.1 hypothetical protein [Vibrio harveyi]
MKSMIFFVIVLYASSSLATSTLNFVFVGHIPPLSSSYFQFDNVTETLFEHTITYDSQTGLVKKKSKQIKALLHTNSQGEYIVSYSGGEKIKID